MLACLALVISSAESCPPPITETLIEEGHYQEALDYIGTESASAFFERARIYSENMKDNKSALREINKAISLTSAQTERSWFYYEFRAQIEEAEHNGSAALDDLEAALKLLGAEYKQNSECCTQVANCANQISVLNQRKKISHRLGDLKSENEDSVQIQLLETRLKEWKKKVEEKYPNGRVKVETISSKQLAELIAKRDPFARYGGKESGRAAFNISGISSDTLKKVISGRTITLKGKHQLYVFPWGFLEIVESSESSPIREAILRSPFSQFRSLCYVWRGRRSEISKADELKLLDEIIALKAGLVQYEAEAYVRELIRLKEFDAAFRACKAGDFFLNALINYEAGRYEEALRLIRTAKPVRDSYGEEIPILESQILVALGQYKEAERIYKKSGLDSGNRSGWDRGTIRFLHGKILLGLNHNPEAVKELMAAKEDFFQFAQIKDRDEVDDLLKRLEKPSSIRQTACGNGDIFVLKSK